MREVGEGANVYNILYSVTLAFFLKKKSRRDERARRWIWRITCKIIPSHPSEKWEREEPETLARGEEARGRKAAGTKGRGRRRKEREQATGATNPRWRFTTAHPSSHRHLLSVPGHQNSTQTRPSFFGFASLGPAFLATVLAASGRARPLRGCLREARITLSVTSLAQLLLRHVVARKLPRKIPAREGSHYMSPSSKPPSGQLRRIPAGPPSPKCSSHHGQQSQTKPRCSPLLRSSEKALQLPAIPPTTAAIIAIFWPTDVVFGHRAAFGRLPLPRPIDLDPCRTPP